MKQSFPAGSLRFRPLDTENGRGSFLRCYEDTWRIAHGTLAGFDAENIWRWTLWRASASGDAVREAYTDAGFAGYLALDERRGRDEGVLWVSFCYVDKSLRGKGFGRALLREAERRARELGRRRVQLCTAEKNPALGFYEAQGYQRIGTEAGALEPLVLLEKETGTEYGEN